MKHTSYFRLRSIGAGVIILCALLVLSCESPADDDNGSIPLSGPRSVQLTARDGRIVAQWTKVASAQGVAPNYEVYWNTFATPGADKKTVESNTSNLVQCEIDGLTNRTTYYVWVKAVFAGLGSSDYSPVVYASPIPPPETPGTISVYPSEALLELGWDAVADAFSYQVYYLAGSNGDAAPPDSAEIKEVAAPASGDAGAVIGGLTNSTPYTVWVRAINTAGASPAYAKNTGRPAVQDSVPASAPTAPTVIPGAGKLNLTWEQVHGVPQYKLYYNTADNSGTATLFGTVPASAPTVSADITGLTNGTLYHVWVKSSNSAGDSGFSPASSGTPAAKPAIQWSNPQFELGSASAEYPFAQDLPPSVFYPEGRPNTDRMTRVQETALGNLFTDGAAWYVRNKLGRNDVDFVFLDGGYIDNALSKGTITVGAISGITQPDSRRDRMMFLTLTGAELKLFFNDVADVVHTGRGGPHETMYWGIVSEEVNYTIQYPKPPAGTSPELSSADSERYYHGIIKAGTLKIKNKNTGVYEAVVDGNTYRICTTDFLVSGEYFLNLATLGVKEPVTDVLFWHAVAEYIYDKGTVTPSLDARIRVEGGMVLPPPWIPGTGE